MVEKTLIYYYKNYINYTFPIFPTFISLLIFFVLFSPEVLCAQKITPMFETMPVPPANRNMMFFLQRTIDRNTVIYEVNLQKNGKINEKKPLKIYWIDYDDGGKISQLTKLQNKFAYGIDFELIDKAKNIFSINLVSYKKLMLTLRTGKDKNYAMFVNINEKEAILSRILVHIIGGTYLKPVVDYIEVTGMDPESGESVSSRIIPD